MTDSIQLTSRYTEAFDFARTIHMGQVRKGSAVPYLAHPMAVSALALAFGAGEDEAIAALLHDTAEDGGGEPVLQHIRTTWGPRVEDLVRACSDSLTEDPAAKAPWRERKKAYLAHLASAPYSVQLVLAADKLHNLESMVADLRMVGSQLWGRFKAGPDDQIWYYESCIRILAASGSAPWVSPLRDALAELIRLRGETS